MKEKPGLDQEVLRVKMAFGLQVQGLTEELKCPICLDFFTDPVTLECGHNFCRSCITESWEKQQINSCAVCQQVFRKRKLAFNWALASLAEKAPKLSLSSTDMEIKRNFEKHQEELKLFCETDKKLLCVVCSHGREHRDHSFLPIDEAAETYKDQVRSSLASLTQRKETAVQAEVKQREKITQVKEQVSSLQTHVTSEFAKLHQSLTDREQLVMGDLTQREKEILQKMETNLRQIQENLHSVTQEISELQKQLGKDTLSFLQQQIDPKRRSSNLDFKLSVCEIDLPEREIRDCIDPAQCEKIDLLERFREQTQVHQELVEEKRLGEEKIHQLEVSVEELRKKLMEEKEAMARKLQEQQSSLRQEIQKSEDLQVTLELIQSLSNKLPPDIIKAVRTLDFTGITLNPPTCALLFKMLHPSVTIERLKLTNCKIRAEGIQCLVPALHKCQYLWLGGNNLGDSGVKSLCEALRNPECEIQILGLGGNNLGDSGVKSLCEALRNPECKIQTLGLDWNSLTDGCTDDLVSALSTSRSLRQLGLGSNSFTDASVPALRRLTLTCTSLESIWLHRNSLTVRSTGKIFCALRTSRTLRKVYLGGNSFTDVAPSSVPARSRVQKMQMMQICHGRKHRDDKFPPVEEAADIYKDQVTCQPSVPWEMYRELQKQMILCLSNLSGDFGHFVRELQPITEPLATLCTDSHCEANQRWVRESQQYYSEVPWHGRETHNKLLSVARTFIRSNNDRAGNIHYIFSNSKLYNDLLQIDREALVQLGASLEAAESLDVVKVDFETLADLCSDLPFANISVHSHAHRLLIQPSISSYTAVLRCIKMQDYWCRREFLHALLLSIKTKSHQVENFHSFRGNEILLPVVINSNWAKKLKTVKLLLHKHVFKQEMSLNRVMWCSPTEAEAFLKTLSTSGYPHIAQELGKIMGSSNVIRFREERPQHQTNKKTDGGPFITDLSTNIYSETQPPKLQLHAKHWIPRTARVTAITDYLHKYCRQPSMSDPWLFRMAGALASEWKAVARDLGFSQSDIEKTATDPWYSHQQRMFHLLHRLTHEQKMSLTELCFLLLCKGREYKCHRQIQDIIGAALSAIDLQQDVDLYRNVGEQPVQQQQQQQQNYSLSAPLTSGGCPNVWRHIKVLGHKRLRLVCDQWTEATEMKELTPKVFESFTNHVSLVGPVFDVHTQTKRTKVLVFLPTYTPFETELSPSALAQSLLTLLTVTHQDVRNDLCEKLEAVLSEEEETKLFIFLLQEDGEAAVRLILSKGQRAAQVLCEYLRTSGSGVRSWPNRHRSMLKTSPRQIGHIQDGNLELVVPLAVLERHLLLFTESLSPLAVIEKLRRFLTQRDAYCLLYKPVGRQYIDCRVTLKVFLIPRNGLFVGELDNKLKGYKQVFIANIKVEPSVRYRLTFQDISSDNPLLCVTPREGSEYQNALTDKDPISEYLITLNGEDWDKWPLVLQITGETDSVIFEKIIEEEMLKLENAEYFTLKLDDNLQCVMRIHRKVSYREFSHQLNTMFPHRKLSVFYTWNGTPLRVENDDSIKMILREQCEKDIFLGAKDINPTEEAQVLPPSSHKPVSFRKPSPTDQHWLVRHRTALINRISDIKGILDEMLQKAVINYNEYQRITAPVCANEKNTCALDCIIKKGEEAMDIFYESLAEKDHYLFQDVQSSEAS